MLILDIETVPLPDAANYLDPVRAAANLKDPKKIADDIAHREAERIEKIGLDWNLSRIVALGVTDSHDGETEVFVCRDEAEEREALIELWSRYSKTNRHYQTGHRLVGFNLWKFDVPFLLQRSRYLGIKAPRLDMRRYGNRDICDLYQILTFDEIQASTVMARSLKSFLRRFGYPGLEPDITGAEIANAYAEGDWAAIERHCRLDVDGTKWLAERIGAIPKVAEVAAALDAAF